MLEKTFINAACQKALEAIQKGDKNALEVIYDVLHKQIYSVAYSVLSSHEDSEDVLQNTLYEILRCAKEYRGGSAKAWILTIARNQALNVLRRRSRETPCDHETNSSVNDVESEFVYLNALSTLAEKEREAFVLKVYCRSKHKEIAEILGISTAAAEKLYQRAVAKLRKYYK